MREIEFRIRYRDKSWFYGVPITKIKNDTVGFQSFDNSYYDLFADATTLGQYTELTDKNGTKIFEGDFIKAKHNTNLYNVYWNEGRFYIEDVWGNLIKPTQTAINHFECEVVGNIYDNPELIGDNNG